MKMENISITADTTIYTGHANAAGYTWLESIFGNQAPEEYARIVRENGESDDRAISSLIEWLEGMIAHGEGFYLRREEADEVYYGVGFHQEPYAFTPREAHEAMMAEARLLSPEYGE